MKGLTTTNTILDKIMAHKIEEIATAKACRSLAALYDVAREAPPVLDMVAVLRQETVSLIAECKKASPSKGVFLEDFDAAFIAREYVTHGARAISVLTDAHFFQGHLDYLRAVKAVVEVPVLRKEFVLDAYQVVEARAAGADAVLLIAACLDDALLADLYAAVEDMGMAALVEVHDAQEMERVLRLDPALVGINNRNLHDFTVDLKTTVALADMVTPDVTLVGESGIYTAADVARLADAGVQAVLVGESLIIAEDRPAKIRELSGVNRP